MKPLKTLNASVTNGEKSKETSHPTNTDTTLSLTNTNMITSCALDRLGQFQELCNFTYFPALKNLHFSLRFPQEIEHTWRMSRFNCNAQYSFDNINYYIDECYMYVSDASDFIPKILFVIYNCPINLLYRYKRSFYNYAFATHVCVPIRTIRRQCVE
jgi:hypothetical protein